MLYMGSRERIKTILRFGIPDHIGVLDAFWPETVARWHQEGLPASLSPHEYFDFDVDYCLNIDTSFMLPERVLEKDEEFIVLSDRHGSIKKYWRKKSGAYEVLDYPIKNTEDWMRYKPLLKASLDRMAARRWGEYALSEEGMPNEASPLWDDAFKKCEDAHRRDKFVFLCVSGPFEGVSNFFNHEDLYIGLVQSPELFADMFCTITDLVIQSFTLLRERALEVDGVFLGDDIAYKNGMIFSPSTYRHLLLPCYQRLCSFFKEQGLTVSFHTDGNLKEALPLLLEAGIRAIQPLEAKAGNDIRELKAVYAGRVVFFGNIDNLALAGSKEDIEREIESKVLIAKESGGYIYHSDHSVPPSVSFDNYCYAMELVKKYGGYAGEKT